MKRFKIAFIATVSMFVLSIIFHSVYTIQGGKWFYDVSFNFRMISTFTILVLIFLRNEIKESD